MDQPPASRPWSGRAAALLLAAVTVAVATPASTTQAAAPGPRTAPTPESRTASAWLPYWDTEIGYLDALSHAAQLHTVSPFWYRTDSATKIKSYKGAGSRRIIDGLHAAGIKVVPTVVESLQAPAMAALLNDPVQRTAHVNALLKVAASQPYDGIELNYEKMGFTTDTQLQTRVRGGFNALVGELCSRLHARGKTCVVTVMPRVNGDGGAYNYRHLGKIVDRMRIMAYNMHWATSGPGPLSSHDWYEGILRYATARVPRSKVELAFPGYGWNWTKGSSAKGANPRAARVTWKEAENLRQSKGLPYRLHASGNPYFTYKEGETEHEVWYQDADGVMAQLPVLKKYGVNNTSLWALGQEDPEFWDAIRRQ
ncbi:glycosyl hydrolase family 18 protein [Actinomycetota bacterium Odt1-20B]